MRRIVLDASAVIRFYLDAPGASVVEEILRDALDRKAQVLMSVINWGEVYYVLSRDQGKTTAEFFLARISGIPIEVENATWEATKLAAEFKVKYSLPYADCFAASLAQRAGAEIVTSDEDFSAVKNEIPVIFL